jgi:hypothetical protein
MNVVYIFCATFDGECFDNGGGRTYNIKVFLTSQNRR